MENFKTKIVNQNNSNKRKKQRKRKIIYFNPPFSLTVATKIGKEFLKLIDKHFDKNTSIINFLTGKQSKYHTAAWKTLKLKYSTTTIKY